MAYDGVVKGRATDWPLTNPWPPMIGGLVAIGVALLTPTPLNFALIVLGLIVVGAAVWMRLANCGWELEDRAHSAGFLTLAAVGCLAAVFGLDASWDSLRMLVGVGGGVALAGALLVLLPPLPRRLVISVLAVVHFGGIVTAVTSVAPPQGSAPYLVTSVWTYFYRHYLQFMYLNNAYHFYSPDPGPPSLLWFAIKYKEGKPRWVQLPARDQFRTRQDYQRYLALGEYTNMVNPMQPPPRVFNDMWVGRNRAGANLGVFPTPEEVLPRSFQFRMPMPYSQHILSSYARYAAKHFPSDVPGDSVESVKVYRVVHNILRPEEMAAGRQPLGTETYMPYYQGTFDAEGNLINSEGRRIFGPPQYDGRGNLMREGDPLLYWSIPPNWVPKKGYVEPPPQPIPEPSRRTHDVIDYTDVHAGFSKADSYKVYGEPWERRHLQ